jgi:hypothetical protein
VHGWRPSDLGKRSPRGPGRVGEIALLSLGGERKSRPHCHSGDRGGVSPAYSLCRDRTGGPGALLLTAYQPGERD